MNNREPMLLTLEERQMVRQFRHLNEQADKVYDDQHDVKVRTLFVSVDQGPRVKLFSNQWGENWKDPELERESDELVAKMIGDCVDAMRRKFAAPAGRFTDSEIAEVMAKEVH